MPHAIGIDVGVTNIKSACIAGDGSILSLDSTPTHADRPDWPGNVSRHLGALEDRFGRADHLGLAAPGLADPNGACISWMHGRLSEVQGLNWTQHFKRPCLVPVLNDAQAALLGEVWKGAAAGARNAMLLTLGTGVGGAVMCDGRILKGHLGRAGHLGHVSLDPSGSPDVTNCPGSLEAAIGNYTVENRSGGRFESTHELVAAYRAGDEEAKRVWLWSVRALAAAVASLINVVDPEVVIIGGGIAVAGDDLFGPLNEMLDRFEWRPHGHRASIVAAQLGEHAGAIGAAWNAIHTPGASST